MQFLLILVSRTAPLMLLHRRCRYHGGVYAEAGGARDPVLGRFSPPLGDDDLDV